MAWEAEKKGLALAVLWTALCLAGCSNAANLARLDDKALAKLEESDICKEINIYHGFNRCSSDAVQRLKKEVLRRYPDWDEKVREAVLNCDIFPGMTARQVAAAWGLPAGAPTQNKNTWTSYENWTYLAGRKKIYLSFENQRLAKIQYFLH